MSKYLITPTLLNSFAYYTQDNEYKSEAEQRQEFLQTLSRVKSEPNEAMRLGLAFEDTLKAYSQGMIDDSNGIYKKYYPELSKIVKGGLWQQVVKKDIVVGTQEFLLYGKCDVIKAGTIYDIKFTSNYELGKFFNSSQHLIYLYCSGLPKFQYLICDGKDYWVEDYYNNEDTEDNIKIKISEFIAYLENDLEAKNLFYDKWKN